MAQQRGFAERGAVLRERLIGACDLLLASAGRPRGAAAGSA